MAFGERLQLLRRRSGLTQEQFAEQLQVSRQAVSKWESDKGYPEMEKLLFICRQYGVTLNDLFEQGENEPISREISPAIPLKASVAAFVSNLSPRNKWLAAGILLDTALRPTPKFKKTQAGKAMHRLTCALDDAVDEVCARLQ